MVCISCVLIPLAIFIWHKFLQPLCAKFLPESWTKSVEAKLDGADAAAKSASCPMTAGKDVSNMENPHLKEEKKDK